MKKELEAIIRELCVRLDVRDLWDDVLPEHREILLESYTARLAAHALALEAELVEAKARALEEAAEAMDDEADAVEAHEPGLGRVVYMRQHAIWLRSRAADVRAGR